MKDGLPEKADVMYMSPRPLISQQRQRRYCCTPLFSSFGESQFKTSNERTIEKEMKRHWHRNGKNRRSERKGERHRERERKRERKLFRLTVTR